MQSENSQNKSKAHITGLVFTETLEKTSDLRNNADKLNRYLQNFCCSSNFRQYRIFHALIWNSQEHIRSHNRTPILKMFIEANETMKTRKLSKWIAMAYELWVCFVFAFVIWCIHRLSQWDGAPFESTKVNWINVNMSHVAIFLIGFAVEFNAKYRITLY